MSKEKNGPEFTEGEVYKIDWLDSGMQVDLGWAPVVEHLKSWKLNDMRVSTCGTLAYEDDDVVGLALSVSAANEHVFGLQLIVKNNIIHSQRLAPTDWNPNAE